MVLQSLKNGFGHMRSKNWERMKKVRANGDSDGEVDDIKMRKHDASIIQSLLNTAPY
jgi:hypothetical protein